MQQHLRAVREGHDWKVEIVEEERSISRLWIVDRHIRVGAASLRVGGIAGVGTDLAYRNRGLSRRVLDHALEVMHREGYHASFLFGIADFYHRFGFATCMPERGGSIDVRSAEMARSKLQVRKARPADFPAIRRLYGRDNLRRTGSVVRHRAWRGFPMGSGFGVPGATHVVHAAATPSRLLGYIHIDAVDDRCRLAEAGGAGEAVQAAILQFLARRAVRLRRARISMSLPADHPFALYCQRFGWRDETRYPRNAGPMGRIIDLQRCLAATAATWAQRWPAGGAAVLTLQTDLGTVSLRCHDGRVSAAAGAAPEGVRLRLTQDVLTQLILGYRTIDDAAGQITGSSRARDLGQALWPLQLSHMWWPDRF